MPPTQIYLEQDGNSLNDSIELNLDWQSQSIINCVAVGGKPAPSFNWYVGEEKLNATIETSEETDENGVILYKSQLEYNADVNHNGQSLRCEVIHEGYSAKQIIDSENIVQVKLNLQACNDHGSNQNHGNNTPCGPCLNGYKGINCELCAPGYFPTSGTDGKVNLTTGEGVVCDCNCTKGVKDGEGCDDSGQCDCKPNFSGTKCETCATGFYDFENDCKGTNMIASFILFATLDFFS